VEAYPFERFSEDSKRVLLLAQEEANRRGGGYVGTEHLLLGILQLRSGSAYRTLLFLDADEADLRFALDTAMGRGGRDKADSLPTSRVKRVIEIAFEEARNAESPTVRTGHLLMGLAWEGTGIAALLLKERVADPERIVAAAERQMS
jgi:ATP-dependent Clp protease ATP-binding subunit ClpC